MDGVSVRLAGTFDVRRDGSPPLGIVGKARRLLALLAVERPGPVPADRIVEVLWPVRPPRQPAGNVATLVSRLRVALGTGVIEGGRDGYRLGSPPTVRVDLDEATRLIAESRRRLADGAPALAATAATAALDMLGTAGVLVDQPDADWVRRARVDGDALLRDARHLVAAAACRLGDPAAGRAAADAAIATDPLDEAAHRLLMTAHRLAGEPARALAAYERLRTDLATQLGADPDTQTRELHLSILREDTRAGSPQRRATAPERPGLVGRSVELARLTSAWSAACAGDSAVVLLAGEGGIGKTRLAAELTAVAERTGGVVLRSRCYAGERSLFLQPFVDALSGPLTGMPAARLRELAGSRAPDVVGLLPRLEAVLGRPATERGSPEFELRRAFEAVTHMLGGLAADRAALVVLDDVHNAGLATVELLHYLARNLTGTRLLLLGTIRAEEGEDALESLADVTERLDLGPLPADAVARLAADAGQGEMTAEIQRRTRGHTLFVVETLRALSAGDRGVPESLQQVVLARLRRAGRATEDLLRAGAVLGATVVPATVADMLGMAPHIAAQRCEVAAAARLLVVAGRSYEFANDLVQEVLYATTPPPTRVAYHRRAAELLSLSPELVAAHAVAAEEWPRAVHALLLAAEEAARKAATADAEALAGRALAAARRADDPALIARALLTRGQARVVKADFRSAFDDQQAALAAARHAGDRTLEMNALRELGGHSGVAVSMAECTTSLRDGLRIAEELGDQGMQARFHAWLAVLASNRLRFAESLDHARRAVAAGRVAGNDTAMVAALDGLKNAFAYLGELGPLSEVLDELLPLARRLGDPLLLQWAVFESAFPAVAAADWAEAERRMGEAIAISERSGYTLHAVWFLAHLGWVARLQGRYECALGHCRRAVELTARTDHRWFATNADVALGTTLLELGRTAEAVERLSAARDRAHRDGAEGYLLRCLAPLAEATGTPETLVDADALLGMISAPDGSAWLLGTDAYLAVARAWLHNGEPARARRRLAPLLAAAQRVRWLPALAAGGLVDGCAVAALGDHASARSAMEEALLLAGRHGLPRVERDARAALDALA